MPYLTALSDTAAPLSVYESAIRLVQVGFCPLRFTPLKQKLETIVGLVIQKACEDLRIPLPENEGAEAFAAPGK